MNQSPPPKPPPSIKAQIARRTAISFTVFILLILAAVWGWRKLYTAPGTKGDESIHAPLRSALNANEKLFSNTFSDTRLAKTYPVSAADKKVRVNGNLGMDAKFDPTTWRLKVVRNPGDTLVLTIDNIKKLPKTEIVFDFKCIEGWDQITHWGGVKFEDFIKAYHLEAQAQKKYIGLVTPDGGYYVGIDMPSAIHPQTILCYEMNGQPLPAIQGAPLRLIIPVKYGIKHLKRIGTLFFSDTPPRDYWAENGYDYYARPLGYQLLNYLCAMSSTWFRRIKKGITTSTGEKKEAPDGLWHKCPDCKETVTIRELQANAYVCPKCEFHNRINAKEYFDLLFDEGVHEKLFENIGPKDKLHFKDVKPYDVRIKDAQRTTGLLDAMTVGVGPIGGAPMVIACMNFNFIGGSMGSVMGEKISRGIDYAIQHHLPFMIISKSGGARMMESAFSLMQMAKTSAKLTQLSKAGLPYISFMTDPTTGGVTASFAMLGDINIAEPKALIGFAGPRVIKETIKKDLPEGFQRSEFLLDHGFLDFIVNRKELKGKLEEVSRWFLQKAS